MEIGFYEEFPSKENLEKLKLIKFKTRLFVAAKSIKEFKKFEKIAKKIKKDIDVIYWPIIPNSYYISPFSNTSDLKKLFQELEKIDNNLLIDLELPLNKRLILKNLFSFFKNKRIIKKFMNKNKHKITTAEPVEILFLKYLKFRGQDFPVKTEKSLMWYTSMISKTVNKNIKKNLIKLRNKNQYSISLGTIAHGIFGNEKILSSKNLEKDLEFVKKAGFKKVIIFRLEGLNKDYLNIIKKFVNP
jgi:hypothetical protein